VREKISEAFVATNSYCNALIGKTMFRSQVSKDFGNELRDLLKSSMPFHEFFGQLGDFIKAVKREDQNTPRRKYLQEDYYRVAVDLHFILSESEYMQFIYEQPVELDELRMEVEAQKEAHVQEKEKSTMLESK